MQGRGRPVVRRYLAASNKTKGMSVKEADSHIPLQIRQWLDRQIARELAGSTTGAQKEPGVTQGEVVRERWFNANKAATATRHQH